MIDLNITYARDLYKKIVQSEGLNKCLVSGFNGNITVYHMIDMDAWLGAIMLRTDELSVYNRGSRIWDVYYRLDESAIEPIRPIESKYIDKIENYDKNLPAIETYNMFPVEKPSLTDLYIYARKALIEGLFEGKDGKVDIKPLNGYYDSVIEGYEINENSIIPFQGIEMITARKFSEISRSIGNSLSIDNSMENDLSV